MQQKYLHEHSLSNNLINNKLRQAMYLKHLRYVEQINNRQAESLQNRLTQYRSISELHKQNKVKANQFSQLETQRDLEHKNQLIYRKIRSIGGNSDIAAWGKNRYIDRSDSLQATDLSTNNFQDNPTPTKPISQSRPVPKITFHSNYRRRQQEQIQKQNAKLMKAILHQRSTILPKICPKRSQSDLQTSRKHSPYALPKQQQLQKK